MVEATTPSAVSEPSSGPGASRAVAGRVGRIALGVAAAILIGLAYRSPLWVSTLRAPQYPDGLRIVVYGDRIAGDVREVDALNHYVGLRTFDIDDLPEVALWGPMIVASVGAVVLSQLCGRRWPGRLARLALWAVPVGVLADIQWRLYRFGHDLVTEPRPALPIEPFTPKVIGPTRILNFTNVAWPGRGVLLLFGAAALLSFGPGLARGVRRLARWLDQPVGRGAGGARKGSGERRPAAALAASLPLLLVVGQAGAQPAARDAAEIQARIDAASAGATVVVGPGVYRGRLVVDEAITLRGEGRPVIDGGGSGSVVTVRADGAVVEGLAVRGSGIGPVEAPAGIRVEADRVVIRDNVVSDTYMGIAAYGASGLRIIGNRITGRTHAAVAGEEHAVDPGSQDDHASHPAPDRRAYRGDGISLWNVERSLVRDNVVEDARDGIYLSYGSGLLLDRNVVRSSRYAVHSMFARELTVAECVFEENLSGAVLMYGGPVLLLRNEIRDSASASTGFGLLLKDVAGVEAIENLLVGNRTGIQVDGPLGDASATIRIVGNTVALNRFGVSLYPSAEVTFSRNSFVENTVQVVAQGSGVEGKSTWYERGLGNHWSDYRGFDLTGEGLGDVPHAVGGALERLLARAPVLEALASGPALGLVRAVEDRWVERRPVAVDPLPLMSPVSWRGRAGPGGGASWIVGLVGLGLTAAAAGGLAAARGRRGSRIARSKGAP
jgi:nitrous oxidase accessory protein